MKTNKGGLFSRRFNRFTNKNRARNERCIGVIRGKILPVTWVDYALKRVKKSFRFYI